jgi:hypothetical protein
MNVARKPERSPTQRLTDPSRGRVHWVTIALGLLLAAASILVIGMLAMIIFTWVTDGIGA